MVDRSRVGLSVADGGKMTLKNSYVGKHEEYGLVVHCDKSCQEEGIWAGEQAVTKAATRHGSIFFQMCQGGGFIIILGILF